MTGEQRTAFIRVRDGHVTVDGDRFVCGPVRDSLTGVDPQIIGSLLAGLVDAGHILADGSGVTESGTLAYLGRL